MRAIAVREHYMGMSRINADHRKAALIEPAPQPAGHHPVSKPIRDAAGARSPFGEAHATGRHLLKQRNCDAHIAALAGGELERDRPTATVGQ